MPLKGTARLLAGDENERVEFKRKLSAIEAEDLVAFANSPDGGVILIGVDQKEVNGKQLGEVCGCEVNDKAKLLIMNKAASCLPPVPLKVSVEQKGKLSFFRVEVPPSKTKPHATSSGTYKIRVDGRVQPLAPDALLRIFVENEANIFVERFRAAAQNLEQAVVRVSEDMLEHIGHVAGELSTLGDSVAVIQQSADVAEDASQNSATNAEQAVANTEEILRKLDEQWHSDEHLHDKTDALLKEHGLEDPRTTAAKLWLERTVWMLMGTKKPSPRELEKIRAKIAPQFRGLGNEAHVNSLIDDAIGRYGTEGNYVLPLLREIEAKRPNRTPPEQSSGRSRPARALSGSQSARERVSGGRRGSSPGRRARPGPHGGSVSIAVREKRTKTDS